MKTSGVRADVDTRPAAMTDALEDAVDYRGLEEVIIEIGTGPRKTLVETLSHRMIDEIFDRFPQVIRVGLSLKKFAAGVPWDPVCVGICLRKTRVGVGNVS
jgi:7,8-dihydroneopterin aldolase/epimerase/oxygenase